MIKMKFILSSLALLMFHLTSFAADINSSVPCQKDMSFDQWKKGVIKEALLHGVSQEKLNLALPYMVLDPEVLKRDQAQGVFQQTFLDFSDRMVSKERISKAHKLIQTTDKDLFAGIENDYGVPSQVVAALWALESDFSAFTGNFQILSSVTTLAYDCRRPETFRRHLISALLLVERGDLAPSQMIGNWAGELGGTQFMADDYLESGVDYDHDGRVDLVKSTPDTLASTANFLVKHGWVRGQPWLQEVKVPATMDWSQADIAIQHPVSQWASFGVKAINGNLADANLPASLILPMGRLGPAFLAYPNFQAFMAWNSSLTYSTTVAYLATRISGAPQVQRAAPEFKALTGDELVDLQTTLAQKGFDVGMADGKLGAATRTAIKQNQLKLGLPADSYPSEQLLTLLKK